MYVYRYRAPLFLHTERLQLSELSIYLYYTLIESSARENFSFESLPEMSLYEAVYNLR